MATTDRTCSGGRLTSHVLDLTSGRPACGVSVQLWRIGPGASRTLLGEQVTDSGGRVDSWPLAGPAAEPGTYELVFGAGDYFAGLGTVVPDPPFLDQVPIRFGVANPEAHYHVPLLIAPWGYSTYRGS